MHHPQGVQALNVEQTGRSRLHYCLSFVYQSLCGYGNKALSLRNGSRKDALSTPRKHLLCGQHLIQARLRRLGCEGSPSDVHTAPLNH